MRHNGEPAPIIEAFRDRALVDERTREREPVRWRRDLLLVAFGVALGTAAAALWFAHELRALLDASLPPSGWWR